MEEIYAKFVSQKISKTRWRPVPPGSLQTAETFATGSWDNEENYVSLWSIGDFGNVDSDGGFEGEHQLLCDIKHHGDVMDLQFFDQERIVAASSTGCVTVFLHHPNNQTLSVSQQWTTAHYHTGPGSPSRSSAPCTGVVCDNPEIVTVGEDGRINLFRADHKEAVRTIDNADSSTLHAVTFLRTPEILTVNSIGQLKIWDFRKQGNEPSQILSLTGDRVPLHCVDRHPNQQHVVATGGQDGMLSIWDVRQGTMPVSLLKAHEAERAPGWHSRLGVRLQPGHDLTVREFEPRVGLWADGSEPGACFQFCVSLSLCPSPVHVLSLSVPKINKRWEKKKKLLEFSHCHTFP
ncbi:nucleoporin Nup43 isoform X2 [Panthera uncia]|uniref:nucleoporin Nup43 isoform X2 n=1 Tax=Panthera uncia TaxID=29064 RepID=UPI0020FFB707|nr:nucleoporin Nup43 isoform X2 [Panthera uncia]